MTQSRRRIEGNGGGMNDKKVKNSCNVLAYLRSHLAVKMSLVMVLAVIVLAAILQFYVQSHYIKYIEDNCVSNETAILDVVNGNVNSTLKSLIVNGSELAVDNGFASYLGIGTSNSVYWYLQQQELPSSVIAIAVVGKNGLVSQYDRYRSGNDGSLWKDSNEDSLMDMYRLVIRNCRLGNQDSFPRYQMFLTPCSYRNMNIFHIVYPILVGTSGLQDVSYVLVITYNFNVFQKYISSIEIPQVDYVSGYILDHEDMVVYTENVSEIGNKISAEREECKVITVPLNYLGLQIAVVIDQSRLRSHVSQIYLNAGWVLIVLLVLYVFLLSFFWNDIRIPVKSISDAIQNNREGKGETKVENILGTHEIWQLAREYNRMIDAVQRQREEIERQHQQSMQSLKNQYEAERRALESQISAHFICNTLGVINFDAIEAHDTKTSQMIKKLSNILRYTFDQSCQKVMIGQEVAWIEQYLFLEKERFEELFTYQIDYDDRYSDWPVCKMMLQPFVENSIIHGFESIETGGKIIITVRERKGKLQVCIRDNGKGMPLEKEQAIRQVISDPDLALHLYQADRSSGMGIGIINAITRMKNFYGKELEISFWTAECEGTRYEFLLPFPKMDELEEMDGDEG